MFSDGSTQILLVAVCILIVALVVVLRRRREPVTAPPQELSQTPESFAVSSLFEATTGSMREGLLVVDKDMRVVASNPAAHKLFNSSMSKLNSQRLTELTRNPAIYSAFLDGLKGVERSGVKVQTHGPERQVFDLRVVPLGGGNGNGGNSSQGATGALGVFFDITRLERLELVRQEFLSNVSHELRTPLTAILAFVETLETSAMDDPESSKRFLSIIRKNASRMHELIDDILELTAIEGGNVRLRAGSVDLHGLVGDVCASLDAKATANGVSLVNDVEPNVTVYADKRRLEQMLTNLIDNGVKFSRDGGTVRISHERGERDQIRVEDNGDGIPAQHLERLFERFYRVDRARSRDMGGTGLGLAIVKHLALLHGGEVTVDSELGKGTIFTIRLPKA
ncbi:MAG TPA: ATP-binding protein [Pyrinomonadaceae bacterium]|nr:ATP-binding protein [Pyrinomonadaceae bacterium]